MQDSILSNANNFAENLSSGVDVRTGSFSVGINIGERNSVFTVVLGIVGKGADFRMGTRVLPGITCG